MKLPYRYALLAAVSLLLLGVYQRDRAFAARARSAEQYVAAQRDTIAALQRAASAAAALAAHVDTIRVIRARQIAVVDATSHPDSTCRPSLEARDRALQAATTEVNALQAAYAAQIAATARLRASNDTLARALASRPRGALTLSLFHPTLHISLQAMLYPVQRVGVGLSYDLADIRL